MKDFSKNDASFSGKSEKKSNTGLDAKVRSDVKRTPTFTSMKKLLKQPAPVEWIISDVLPANSLVGFVGPPESFKSAIVCSMAVAIASNIPWNGYKVKPSPVFILIGEGRAGLARRLKAIQMDGEIDTDAPVHVSDMGAALVDYERLRALMKRMDRVADKAGGPPALIVIDTVARNFAPGDENSASDMGAFIENVDLLRRHFKCTVVLVHHTGHRDKSRARGSSAFKAALDHEILFNRKENQVTLKCTKSKDAEPFNPISLELEQIELPWRNSDGKNETSFVLRSSDIAVTSGALPKKQIAAFKVLKRLISKSEIEVEWNDGNVRKAVSKREWQSKVLAEGIVANDRAFEKLVTKLRAKRLVLPSKRGKVAIV